MSDAEPEDRLSFEQALGKLEKMVQQLEDGNLTLDEWREFVGQDIPYERTCPNRPIHPSVLETAENMANASSLPTQ